MKIIIFRGDLTDSSAKKEALVHTTLNTLRRNSTFRFCWFRQHWYSYYQYLQSCLPMTITLVWHHLILFATWVKAFPRLVLKKKQNKTFSSPGWKSGRTCWSSLLLLLVLAHIQEFALLAISASVFKSNNFFFGFFDPKNIFLDCENK